MLLLESTCSTFYTYLYLFSVILSDDGHPAMCPFVYVFVRGWQEVNRVIENRPIKLTFVHINSMKNILFEGIL